MLQVRESGLEKLLEQSNVTPHKEVARLEEERQQLQKRVEVHMQQNLLVFKLCYVGICGFLNNTFITSINLILH